MGQQSSAKLGSCGDLASKDVQQLCVLVRDTFQQAQTEGNLEAALSASLGGASCKENCTSLNMEESCERMKQAFVQASTEGSLDAAIAKVRRASETRGSSHCNQQDSTKSEEELRVDARQLLTRATTSGTLAQALNNSRLA